MDTTTRIVEENVDLSTNFSPESTSGHEISTDNMHVRFLV